MQRSSNCVWCLEKNAIIIQCVRSRSQTTWLFTRLQLDPQSAVCLTGRWWTYTGCSVLNCTDIACGSSGVEISSLCFTLPYLHIFSPVPLPNKFGAPCSTALFLNLWHVTINLIRHQISDIMTYTNDWYSTVSKFVNLDVRDFELWWSRSLTISRLTATIWVVPHS